MMNMYKFPYRFEPMPEIADRLNLAWFDEHYGEERMKEHIRKHKLKSHPVSYTHLTLPTTFGV